MTAKRLFATSCGRRVGGALLLAVSVGAAGVLASSGAARPAGGVTAAVAPVGHFACYAVDQSSAPPSHGVVVHDQFGTAKTVTGQLLQVCAPVRKNGSVLVNPRAHLACYALKQRPFVPRTVVISNQLERGARFRVVKPIKLCLPSGKSVQPAPPPSQVKGLSHFQCYLIKTLTPFKQRRVSLVDQFGGSDAVVLPATSLCVPVSKDRSLILNKTTHLVCYPLTSTQPFQARRLTITNQFGSIKVVAFRRDSVCVPSTKRVLPPPRPDLTVAIDKTHNPQVSCTSAGCITTINFTVSNIGAVAVTAAFAILVEADPNLGVTKTVAGPVPLAAGASQMLSVQVGPAGACYDPDCSIRVTVDSGNTIAESDETNNTDTFTGIG